MTREDPNPSICNMSSSCSTSSNDEDDYLFDYEQTQTQHSRSPVINSAVKQLYEQNFLFQRPPSRRQSDNICSGYKDKYDITMHSDNFRKEPSNEDISSTITCRQCQEQEEQITTEENNPQTLYDVIPYNSCSTNCILCRSNKECQSLKPPDLDKQCEAFQEYPTAKNIKNIRKQSLRKKFTKPLEKTHHKIKPSETVRNTSKNYLKGWKNSCSSIMCSRVIQNDSSEESDRTRQEEGMVDDSQFSTYQKFDRVCHQLDANELATTVYSNALDSPVEPEPDFQSDQLTVQQPSPTYESSPNIEEVPIANIEEVPVTDDAKDLQPKGEFDDLLYISKEEMDNLLRIDSHNDTQNILNYSKPINDLIQRNSRVYDRVVPTNSKISTKLKEMGNSNLYRKREERRRQGLKKQKSLPNFYASKKLSMRNLATNQLRNSELKLNAEKLNKTASSSNLSCAASKMVVKPNRPRKLTIGPVISSIPPKSFSPVSESGGKTLSELMFHSSKHKQYAKTDAIPKEMKESKSNLETTKSESAHSLSELDENQPASLKSILRNNKTS